MTIKGFTTLGGELHGTYGPIKVLYVRRAWFGRHHVVRLRFPDGTTRDVRVGDTITININLSVNNAAE